MLAARGGTGLATVIERQLSGGAPATASSGEEGFPLVPPSRAYPLDGVGKALPLPSAHPETPALPLDRSPVRPSLAAAADLAQSAVSPGLTFVHNLLPHARTASQMTGIPAAYLIGHAALESGWGKAEPRFADGRPSHNLFGIKATGSWQGAQARAITSEFKGGQMVKETAAFRSYDSYQDSFHDLVTLLQSNNRYKEVLNAADKPEQFVRELQKAGYATDPNYASKISQIAKQMKTYQSYASTGSLTNL